MKTFILIVSLLTLGVPALPEPQGSYDIGGDVVRTPGMPNAPAEDATEQAKSAPLINANAWEATAAITPEGSWHADYRDTAFIYFGGLPYELTEGDVITIFSQFGEPTFLKLARDKETGKSKGFGWLQYEDQRSTDLAVDNLGGADVGGRIISVDHARYKARDDEDPAEFDVSWEAMMRKEGKLKETDDDDDDGEEVGKTGEASESRRRMLPEERELAILIRDHDEDDPMKAFLVEEKKKEVEEARRNAERAHKRGSHGRGHRSHRRRDESPKERDRRHRHRDREEKRDRDRSKDAHGDRESRGRRGDDARDDRRRKRPHRDDDEDRSRRRKRGHESDGDSDRDRGRDRHGHGTRHERNRSVDSRPERSRRDNDRHLSRSRSPRYRRD
ncbi:hypothetical protein E4U53_007999 [Claviceps sorghi]|nr:hypothetical protein E4U53_007999 [Claviceps sorghi]